MANEKGRTYAFIDSQNLNLGVRNDVTDQDGKTIYSGWKLDFKRFFVYLRDKYGVEKAFLFIGKKAGEEKLHKFLSDSGYEMIFKPTVTQHDGTTKGNVDAELVLHTMIEIENYEQAIIVSGDGDFACLLNYLEQQEKLGKILIPNKYKYSSLLRKFAHRIAYVSDLRLKLEHK